MIDRGNWVKCRQLAPPPPCPLKRATVPPELRVEPGIADQPSRHQKRMHHPRSHKPVHRDECRSEDISWLHPVLYSYSSHCALGGIIQWLVGCKAARVGRPRCRLLFHARQCNRLVRPSLPRLQRSLFGARMGMLSKAIDAVALHPSLRALQVILAVLTIDFAYNVQDWVRAGHHLVLKLVFL